MMWTLSALKIYELIEAGRVTFNDFFAAMIEWLAAESMTEWLAAESMIEWLAVAAVMMIYLCSLRCARLAAVGDFLVLSGTKIYISEQHT